eukprot:10614313-Alexandrium_andersonii.AAC.1
MPTKTAISAEGKIMWRQEYVELAQTKTGGGLADDQAVANGRRGWLTSRAMARPRSSTMPRGARAFPFQVLGQDARRDLLRGVRRASEAAQ